MSAPVASPRNARIDALKFFAIAIVVLGHVLSLPIYRGDFETAVQVITAFNMPLFMFLSGYVLFGREGSSPLAFVQRKFFALIVPYFAWYLIALARWQPVADWPRLLGEAVVQPHDPARLWFLYVLFIFYVLFVLVRLVGTSDWLLTAAAVVVAGLVVLPDGDMFGRLNVQWLFPFFVAGYLIAKHRSRVTLRLSWAAPLVAVAFVGLALGGRVAEAHGWAVELGRYLAVYFKPLYLVGVGAYVAGKYAIAFVGIAASCLLYLNLSPRLLGWQASAGRRSLGIYAVQGSLLVLATGQTLAAALSSWIIILFAALGVALLLEKTEVTRVLLLGAKPRRAWAGRSLSRSRQAPVRDDRPADPEPGPADA